MSILAPPLSGNLSAGTLQPDREIGALWRRIVAFAVDGIILGVVGSVIALPFFDAFSRLGAWGPLIGFCLALPYFAILNSSIGNGQTLGKRLMHLQVVDKDGNAISLSKSAVRYGIFALPYYLNGMVLPMSRTPWFVSTAIFILVVTIGGATLYLVLFNRHTRQGLHDLAVGSYVAEADKSGPLKIDPIWRNHWVILGSLLVVFSVGAGILRNTVAKSGSFPQLLEDVRLVEAMKDVRAAGARDLTSSAWGGGEKKTILVINVYWTGESAEEQSAADLVAKQIIQEDSTIKDHDSLRINMIRGYDLGIAHGQVSQFYEHTPAEWNTRLFGPEPARSSSPAKP